MEEGPNFYFTYDVRDGYAVLQNWSIRKCGSKGCKASGFLSVVNVLIVVFSSWSAIILFSF